ncbi:DUF397 domain-containing protein [Streptomyces sp. FXJ1.4098]|uniref:DUF397 domain-containing protein n=1 Tax=Streptomyces sp. NPDC020845 TaxID=3365096 RepID=UPI00299A81BC|nr:DUF397 domain-containing protein [Streptomyces sp. FXJ1.4098]
MSERIWRKSSFSTGPQGECVEVATGPDGLIHFRESDDPRVTAATTRAIWSAFLTAAKAGNFDRLTG